MPWLTSLAGFEAQLNCIAIGGFSETIQPVSVAREHNQGWQRLRALLQGSWQCRIHVPAAPYVRTEASRTHIPGKLKNVEEMGSPKVVASHLDGRQNHQVRCKKASEMPSQLYLFWERFASCFSVTFWTCFGVVCNTASGVFASESQNLSIVQRNELELQD